MIGLTDQPTEELTCNVDDKTTSLVEYFKNTYQYIIHYTHLPCLQVNNPKRKVYLPMEICEIVEGQKYSKRLSDRQLTALLSATCQRPKERQMQITRFASHNDYPNDTYAQEFGIRIGENLATVEARLLPTPRLKYHETGKEKDCLPQVGQWNMMKKKMVNGGTVENWICINFARNVQDPSARGFCNELAKACKIYGMKFNPEPVVPQINAQAEQVERELKTHYLEAMAMIGDKDVDLLIAILPENNGSLYGDIKRICETELGISQSESLFIGMVLAWGSLLRFWFTNSMQYERLVIQYNQIISLLSRLSSCKRDIKPGCFLTTIMIVGLLIRVATFCLELLWTPRYANQINLIFICVVMVV